MSKVSTVQYKLNPKSKPNDKNIEHFVVFELFEISFFLKEFSRILLMLNYKVIMYAVPKHCAIIYS